MEGAGWDSRACVLDASRTARREARRGRAGATTFPHDTQNRMGGAHTNTRYWSLRRVSGGPAIDIRDSGSLRNVPFSLPAFLRSKSCGEATEVHHRALLVVEHEKRMIGMDGAAASKVLPRYDLPVKRGIRFVARVEEVYDECVLILVEDLECEQSAVGRPLKCTFSTTLSAPTHQRVEGKVSSIKGMVKIVTKEKAIRGVE